jgi:hypothetical protein
MTTLELLHQVARKLNEWISLKPQIDDNEDYSFLDHFWEE